MSHTPGPWEWDQYGSLIGKNKEFVLWFGGNGDAGGIGTEDNERLIMAAPDLLEALQSCVKAMTMQNYRLNEALIEKCKSIISKATQE